MPRLTTALLNDKTKQQGGHKMKVIKKGRKGGRAWQLKCTGKGYGGGGCGALLLISKKDICNLNDHCNSPNFECPECHTATDVPEKILTLLQH